MKKKRTRQVFIQIEPQSGRRVVVKRYVNPDDSEAEYAVMQAYGEQRNLVRLLDFVLVKKQANLVMEWVNGRTVEEIVNEKGPLDPKTVVRIALEILAGLEALHGLGYVHGDLHGGNVMVMQRSRPDKKNKKKKSKDVPEHEPTDLEATQREVKTPLIKIIDFQHGVPKDEHGKATALRLLPEPPDHLAPETSNGQIDDSYDVYGVGYMCAQMLAGKAPRRTDVLEGAYGEGPLWQVVCKALQEKPWQRYASAAQMAAALRRLKL